MISPLLKVTHKPALLGKEGCPTSFYNPSTKKVL
ncbi:MAG: hypothetical protein H6Q67_738 [Firmicutes bacterium]|nr:hypothetical protein [Bacillota bacterium]